MAGLFNRIATGCARFSGRPSMLMACMIISGLGVLAYVSGDDHFFGGANLAISIVTLLLLPILQATQNRDGAALQAKIDELIKLNHDARNTLIGLENRSEERLSGCARPSKKAQDGCIRRIKYRLRSVARFFPLSPWPRVMPIWIPITQNGAGALNSS